MSGHRKQLQMSKHQTIFNDRESRKLIGRVLRENFHLYYGRYLLAFLLMGFTALATALSVFMMKNITAVVFGSKEKAAEASFISKDSAAAEWLGSITRWFTQLFHTDHPGMLQIASVSIGIILIFLVKGLSEYGSNVILSQIGNNIVARQQQRVGHHILGQSLAFFVHFPSNELLTRVSQATAAARNVMQLLMTRVQDVFTAVALVIAMFKLDWKLSSIALFILGPVVLILGYIIRRVRQISRGQYRNFSQIISAFQETIVGNKLIKSYNLEQTMRERFDQTIASVEKLSNRIASLTARTSPSMELIGGISVAMIVFYGGYRNLILGENADSLIAFLTAMLLAYEPVKRIAKMNVQLHSALVGVEMLYQVIDSDYSISDEPSAVPLRISKGRIVLNQVRFAYRTGMPVIHDLSLVCEGGQVTALVGPSGSGKSTILSLIERFYQPDAGRIEIDGQDVETLQTQSLRAHLSLVSQDTFLFADTLRNNIRFARPDATDEEVETAAKAAFAHEFILQQPQGYNTHVGENGGNLSGGQRQRISIARAFLKNAPILLLDEATSALDSESEQKIQSAFDELMKGRTTVVIAHRFSTIRNAAKIHVMQEGHLVSSGSHDELMQDEYGLYAHLYRLQYQENADSLGIEEC